MRVRDMELPESPVPSRSDSAPLASHAVNALRWAGGTKGSLLLLLCTSSRSRGDQTF